MHLEESVREYVERVREALWRWDERALLNRVDAALAGTDSELLSWAMSDELWGGDGSIADGCGGSARVAWREIEAALIELGEYQLAAGFEHERMECWICAFKADVAAASN